jgi:uncharacterized protein (TIGR00725 family)
VAVVGPGDSTDPALLAAAERIGAGIGGDGHLLVTGGLGGVMAAAARGAREAGGSVVGLLPGEHADAANDSVDIALPTGLGQGRNLLVVRAAEVVVGVGGSWGTLAEIALARRLDRPVVWLWGWQLTGPPDDRALVRAVDPDGALATVREWLRG